MVDLYIKMSIGEKHMPVKQSFRELSHIPHREVIVSCSKHPYTLIGITINWLGALWYYLDFLWYVPVFFLYQGSPTTASRYRATTLSSSEPTRKASKLTNRSSRMDWALLLAMSVANLFS